uniref:Aminotransferase class I/classII domain-containing protein n=1 Tax=Panagrolaimus sp. JU765 TaxID=591449 RepID=A0AC34QR22_9BILA
MPLKLLRSDLHDYHSASNLLFNNQIKELIANGRKIYHFGFGESPFTVPEPFKRGLIESADRNEYLSVEGLHELREQILNFHEKYGDFSHFTVEDFVLGAGSKEIIYHIMNVFGGEVLLVSPAWTSYFPQTQLSGRPAIVIEPRKENRFVPTKADIETALRLCDAELPKVLVLNSPNNPTGVVYTESEVEEIVLTCRKHKILILSDEIYARLTTKKFTSFAKLYPEGTIVTSGFSKWASLGGWRAGYALFPKELAGLRMAVASAGSHSYTCQPAPVQHALTIGLKHLDELDDYIQRTTKVLSLAGHFCYRKLNEVGVTAVEPDGAYYFMPDFEICRQYGIEHGQKLCDRLLEEANVALQPCDPHYLRPRNELTTRFAFVNFKGKDAMDAVDVDKTYSEKEEAEFLKKHAKPLVDGISALVEFVKKLEG